MSRFTKILVVSPLADGRTWYLQEEFGYDVGAEGSHDRIDVPAGFLTDFASVPRLLWTFFPRWGRYGNAAVIHDFLYWERSRGKWESDKIFLEAMEVLKVSWFTRHLMFLAVVVGGLWTWWRRGGKQVRLGKFAKRAPLKCGTLPAQLTVEEDPPPPPESKPKADQNA